MSQEVSRFGFTTLQGVVQVLRTQESCFLPSFSRSVGLFSCFRIIIFNFGWIKRSSFLPSLSPCLLFRPSSFLPSSSPLLYPSLFLSSPLFSSPRLSSLSSPLSLVSLFFIAQVQSTHLSVNTFQEPQQMLETPDNTKHLTYICQGSFLNLHTYDEVQLTHEAWKEINGNYS